MRRADSGSAHADAVLGGVRSARPRHRDLGTQAPPAPSGTQSERTRDLDISALVRTVLRRSWRSDTGSRTPRSVSASLTGQSSRPLQLLTASLPISTWSQEGTGTRRRICSNMLDRSVLADFHRGSDIGLGLLSTATAR